MLPQQPTVTQRCCQPQPAIFRNATRVQRFRLMKFVQVELSNASPYDNTAIFTSRGRHKILTTCAGPRHLHRFRAAQPGPGWQGDRGCRLVISCEECGPARCGPVPASACLTDPLALVQSMPLSGCVRRLVSAQCCGVTQLGLDTELVEGSATLSTGQRQQLSAAAECAHPHPGRGNAQYARTASAHKSGGAAYILQPVSRGSA